VVTGPSPRSYGVEVLFRGESKFVGNALFFPTKEQAQSYEFAQGMNWIGYIESRVVPRDQEPNYTFINGKLERIPKEV